MLSDEETKEIEDDLAHYPTRRAGTIEALKTVQRRRGFVFVVMLLNLGSRAVEQEARWLDPHM